MRNSTVMILAGGQGSRIYPLSRDRAKPAIPFGGKYRIIDFVLNNLVNSGFFQVYVITQFKSQSLNKHVEMGWRMSPQMGHFISLVPAQMRMGMTWYRGTADAIYQNFNLFDEDNPHAEHVMVFGGDHVYKMDVNQFLDHHIEKKADLTVCVIPVDKKEAGEFGVVEVDKNWRIVGFQEKPENPKTIPGDENRSLISMGNYIFKKDIILRELMRGEEENRPEYDFGKHTIPQMIDRCNVFAYDFSRNSHPGMSEKERGYWRDVGTIEAYFEANLDLVSVSPQLNLYNAQWPLHTYHPAYPPAKFVFDKESERRVGHAIDSIVSSGCIISGGKVIKSVLSPGVRVNSYAQVEESILMERVEIGRHCKIRRAIIDKEVSVPEGTVIGYNPNEDRKRFFVTDTGITVIPKKEHLI
ncbi:MAG: glucose-1-phosphate adenylyltransferase [Candidatus Aureabacteria bacterium]|nr:glucose-1-phosphate adenylyltransferase [Candidatus Auribacterota bacterium]